MQFAKPHFGSNVVLTDGDTKAACNEVGGDYQIVKFKIVDAKCSCTLVVSGFGFEIGEHTVEENGKITNPVVSTTPNPRIKDAQIPLQTGKFTMKIADGQCTIVAPDGTQKSGPFDPAKAAATLGGYVSLTIQDYSAE